ncbi:MAG: HDIG domain-containing protein [Clostridia bacterium]|nr:HDIG domain-containing protein [Clostridia bacterium]
MIDNVKDLSRAERIKQLERKKLRNAILKCLFPMVVVGVGMAVYGLFVFGNFTEYFEEEQLAGTIGRMLLGIGLMAILFGGVYEYTRSKNTSVRDYWLTAIMMLITYVISASLSGFVNIYIMPLSLATFVLIELIDRRTATLTTAAMLVMFIVTFAFTNRPEDIVLQEAVSSVVIGAMSAVLVNFLEKKHFSRIKYLLVSLFTPLIVQPMNVFLTLMMEDYSINILFHVLYAYAASVGAALVFMPIVYIFESIFNIADDFRLNELCQLSHPLLKRLASEAPGTFNHSLVVGNLAEACASAIGENPHMARCAAYYHDIGKLKAPIYFSENQSTYNPHDELIPEVSVSMITSHTLFGEILAKQNKLPKEIVDICRQHHGTSPVSYFYRKAINLKEEGDLAMDQYKYAGPKPQTKVAALIMIADTIEAAMRAYMPDTREEYEQRITSLIDEKISLRQFDECPITMGDIDIIKKTIIEVLPSIHHSRIDYNKKKK